MTKRLTSIALVVASIGAAGGLFAGPSHSARQAGNCNPVFGCPVALTDTGPVPSTLEMGALQTARFSNTGSVTHTVVFANGLCSLRLTPGTAGADAGTVCDNGFLRFVGTYAYTVDGKFPGTVITTAWSRTVSLTARAHAIRGGTSLILHGLLRQRSGPGAPPPPVVVLARHNRTQPFEPVATVRTKGSPRTTYRWKLRVQPAVRATYMAEVTAQRLCYYPASRCEHPQGQVWVNAKSPLFTVRVRR